VGVLGHVRQAFGDQEVGRDLDLLRRARVERDREPHRHRHAGDQPLQRHLQPAPGDDGRVDAARKLAQLLERARELTARLLQRAPCVGIVAEPPLEHPEVERERDQPLLGAVVQVALEPAPLALGGLEDARARAAQLVELGVQLRVQARPLQREAGRRADGVEERGLVVQRGVVQQRRDGRPCAVHDVRPALELGGQLDRLALEVGVRAVLGEPVGDPQRRVAEGPRDRGAQGLRRRAAVQRQHELPDGRPGEARTQHVDEHRHRHGRDDDDHRGGEPQVQVGVGELGGHELRVGEEQRGGAGEDGRQPLPLRRRGPAPAAPELRHQHERGDHVDHALGRVHGVRDARVRPREQDVARLSRPEVEEEQPEQLERARGQDERRDEQHVPARGEAPAGEGDEEEDEQDDPRIGGPQAERERERRVEALRRRRREPPAAEEHHEPAEALLGPVAPCDQAAREEGAPHEHRRRLQMADPLPLLVGQRAREQPRAARRADQPQRTPHGAPARRSRLPTHPAGTPQGLLLSGTPERRYAARRADSSAPPHRLPRR
jgi:hypothetical protein